MASFTSDPIEYVRNLCQINNRLIVNLLSEFLGTFLLVLIGCSSIAQHVLPEGKLNNHLQVFIF
jgi:glycerol uptake facilitator-like aquaporin